MCVTIDHIHITVSYMVYVVKPFTSSTSCSMHVNYLSYAQTLSHVRKRGSGVLSDLSCHMGQGGVEHQYRSLFSVVPMLLNFLYTSPASSQVPDVACRHILCSRPCPKWQEMLLRILTLFSLFRRVWESGTSRQHGRDGQQLE